MRHHVINTILSHALSQNQTAGRFSQFLILGAGTDTSFWRLNINSTKIKWFEIDFPQNLKIKQVLMEKNFGPSKNYIPGIALPERNVIVLRFIQYSS